MSRDLLERNAAYDAPTRSEYDRLYWAACDTDEYEIRTENRFIVFSTGRLGFRSGELLHFLHVDEDLWLDRHRKVITIPAHADCSCRYCHERAQAMADDHDDLTQSDAVEGYWKPKYEASVRVIPYGWSAEAIEIVETFADDVGGLMMAQSTVNRRLNRLAETAGVEDVYPHALRAAAGFFWARKGLEALYLQALMGWEDMRVANRYIRATGAQLNDRVLELTEDAPDRPLDVPAEELPDPTEEVYRRAGRAPRAGGRPDASEPETTLWDFAVEN